MTTKAPTHTKDGKFAIGNNANPRGAAAHSPVRRAFRKLTEKQFQDFINILMSCHPEDLEDYYQQNPTVINRWLITAAIKGMKSGDTSELRWMIERTLGKVKDVSEITHKGSKNKSLKIEFVATAPSGEEKKIPDADKELT